MPDGWIGAGLCRPASQTKLKKARPEDVVKMVTSDKVGGILRGSEVI